MRCGPAYGLLACLALTGLAEVTSDISPATDELRQIVASADDISAVAGALKSGGRAVLYFDASSDRCAPLHLHITSQRNGVLGFVHAFALTCARVITDIHTLTNGLQRPCCTMDRKMFSGSRAEAITLAMLRLAGAAPCIDDVLAKVITCVRGKLRRFQALTLQVQLLDARCHA